MTDFANRYVSIEREDAYGTANSPANSILFGEVDDESIQPRFDIIERGDMNYWAMQKSKNGKEYSEGDLNFVLQADDFCGMLFWGAMGSDSFSDPTHTMVEATTSALPSFIIKVGREEKAHVYTGMMINRMSISGNVGEYVTASFSFSGKAESDLEALATPTWAGGSGNSAAAEVDGYHFANCSVKFDADTDASTFVKSFSLELNNNLDTDNACSIGSSTYSRAPIMQRREITGSLEFNQPILDDSTPSGGNTEPFWWKTGSPDTGMVANGGLEVIDTTYAIQFTLSDGTNNTVLTLYDVRYEAPTANVSGRDTETMSVNFRAYIDPATPAAGALKVEFGTVNGGVGENASAYSAL